MAAWKLPKEPAQPFAKTASFPSDGILDGFQRYLRTSAFHQRDPEGPQRADFALPGLAHD
jgi:hypothetical protein